MRPLLLLCLVAAAAAADPIAIRFVEDAALGVELAPGTRVLSPRHEAAMAACGGEPTSGAVFWIELARAGTVVAAKVHGSGKPATDACLEAALRKAAPAGKLAAPVVIAGHIELGTSPPPRQSQTAVVIAPHDAKWQLTVHRLAYTANRAADIAQALDGASTAIAACAPRRGGEPAQAIAWLDGKAIVRSGTPAYDDCVAKALDAIKLPVPESALWLKLAITEPTEPLAARTDKPSLSRDQALRDALSTAVRSRKPVLLTCLDRTANARIDKVSVALAAGKATIATVSTGDAAADACVKKRFGEVAIPNANPDDKLVLDVRLD